MAVGDIYQITLKANRGAGNDLLNVFFYRCISADVSADELGYAFQNQVLPEIAAANSTSWHGDVLITKNLFDPLDFEIDDISVIDGTRTGTALQSFYAAKLMCLRRRLDMRHGWKTISPLMEEDVVGSWYTSTMEGLLFDMATACGANLEVEEEDSFVPVIVQRIKEGPEGGPYTYRLPENQEETVYYVADQWQVRNIGSMNSRKAGRGS